MIRRCINLAGRVLRTVAHARTADNENDPALYGYLDVHLAGRNTDVGSGALSAASEGVAVAGELARRTMA